MLTGMLAVKEHLAYNMVTCDGWRTNNVVKSQSSFLYSSYLRNISFGPFFREENYDCASKIRGKFWLAKLFEGTQANLRGKMF
jgi:hypothetical protein